MITPSFSLTATERVLPKMALDFTTASLDSRVTFTRTGNTATVTNSSGFVVPINADLPRFDFNPIALTCKGLLIEESRTNLLLYSEDLSNVVWTKSLLNTTGTPPWVDVGVSPSNAQNAELVIPNTSSSALHNISTTTPVITGGATISVSIFVKAGGYNFVLLRASNAPESQAFQTTINLTNGTVSTAVAYGAGASAVNATITAYPNSWYRVTLTGAVAGLTVYKITAYVYAASNSAAFAGDGTSGVYMWGAQAEIGAFPTSYIPTTLSQVTRNADVATMTGTNFSDWYTATTGAATVWAIPQTATGTRPLVQFDDTTANEIIVLGGNVANPEMSIVDGGAPQAQIDAGTIVANTAYKLTGAWNTDSCAAAQNGAAAVTDNTATIPTPTQLRIGSDGTNYASAWVQKILYYPQRIINAEVQAFSK